MSSINDRITGLLGDPTLALGVGLLAHGGPTRGETSFGQRLAGALGFFDESQRQRLTLEAARDRLAEKQEQKNIFQQLGGLLGPQMSPGPVVAPIGPPAITTPAGQQQALGLLSQVAPGSVASAALSQLFPQQPTLSRELNDFQYFAENPDQLGAYREFQQSNRDPIEATREQLQSLQVQQALQELAQSRESAAQQRANTQLSTIQDLESLKRLAERNDSLRGTFLESGLPARGMARSALGTVQALQDAFGLDSSNSRKVISDFDSFDKLASNLTLNSLARYSALGALNSSELQQVVRANAQIGASPDTNAEIISGAIKTIVRSAQASGVQIENPDEWLQFADSLMSDQGQPSAPPSSPSSAPLVIDLNDLD